MHSEFRDGNVSAGYQQLRVLTEALERLPDGVDKVMLRSDTAGYQQQLLRYCTEGRNERFGVIEFAVGVDVTMEFRRAVSAIAQKEWCVLYRKVGERLVDMGQQWAEVNFVAQLDRAQQEQPRISVHSDQRAVERTTSAWDGETVGVLLPCDEDVQRRLSQGLRSSDQPRPSGRRVDQIGRAHV